MFASFRTVESGDGSIEVQVDNRVNKLQFLFRHNEKVSGTIRLDVSDVRALAAFLAVVVPK